MTTSTSRVHVTDTKFWNTVMHDVYGPRSGGAIIFLDAENARKGVAKTSCAVATARLFARAFDYDLQPEDFTLSGAEYLTRYQEQPGEEQPSVLVLDEFVGGGAGDKRRAMSQQNVDFGRAWQLLRTRRVITIATLPDWNSADKRLKKLADYRMWCREEPMGYFQPYKVTVPFSANGPGVRTKGLNKAGSSARKIKFPNMDAADDEFYRHLGEKKGELIDSDSWDADDLVDGEGEPEVADPDEVKREQAIRFAIRMYEPWDDDNTNTYADVAEVVDDYGKSWVGNRIKEWEKGKHRDLVEVPEWAT